MNENDLMSRLMISKAIMDKSDGIRNTNSGGISQPSLQNFDMPNVKYNIPQEYLQEQTQVNQPYLSSLPRENTKPVGVPSLDAIKNSKLPDEIKKLMMEHPIAQAQQPQMTISNELVEKASRLMKKESNNYIPESASKNEKTSQTQTQLDYNLLKKIVKEVIEESFSENGLLVESTEKTNDVFTFKVGKHIFEGKLTKIKKVI